MASISALPLPIKKRLDITGLATDGSKRITITPGSFTITSNDANTKLVSATFETTLNDLLDPAVIIKITAGKISNVNYAVLNYIIPIQHQYKSSA